MSTEFTSAAKESWRRAWARHKRAEDRFSKLSGQFGREWHEHLSADPWDAKPTTRLLRLEACVDKAGRIWNSSRPLSWTGWQIRRFLDARSRPDHRDAGSHGSRLESFSAFE